MVELLCSESQILSNLIILYITSSQLVDKFAHNKNFFLWRPMVSQHKFLFCFSVTQ